MTRAVRRRVVLAMAVLVVISASAAWSQSQAKDTVNCADLGHTVAGTLEANLEVTEHGSKCVVTGTVDGNVTVRDDSSVCAPPPQGVGQAAEELTAVNVIGGTVEGSITSFGGLCAMIWLRHGATVDGNVTHGAAGNLGFLDIPGEVHPGSVVHGNVVVKSGKLFASSVAADNRVDRHITCVRGVPSSGTGNAADWDGDGDSDGTIGGHYRCPPSAESGAKKVTRAPVVWHAQSGNSGAVSKARARLVTTSWGATFSVRAAELSRKHAYTVWLVIVNNPSACDPAPCTAPDILNNPETESQVTFADGRIARGRTGRLRFRAHAPVGEVAGWLENRFFYNPLGAEIHIVINDHGPVLPAFMPDMKRTYRGGCTDDSLPAIFPPSAFADGEPGPNTCRLFQSAVFQQ